jgi:hypothetical protein
MLYPLVYLRHGRRTAVLSRPDAGATDCEHETFESPRPRSLEAVLEAPTEGSPSRSWISRIFSLERRRTLPSSLSEKLEDLLTLP